MTTLLRALAALCVAVAVAGCGGANSNGAAPASTPAVAMPKTPAATPPGNAGVKGMRLLPGMPAPLDAHDIYAADRPNQLSAVVRDFPQRVYVPNSQSNTVDVIDPKTFRIIDHFAVGGLPQHIVPSWDLRKLWVTNDSGNSLTAIDPATGKPGATVAVEDPYNMYFTPDGKYAIVVAERLRRLDFRDAHSMQLVHSVSVPGCPGMDHLDFTADGRTLLASCEFGGRMAIVDVEHQRPLRTISLPRQPQEPGVGMPQDVKLSPDGTTFYTADMMANGVYSIDAHSFRITGFTHTGHGTHGLYVSRDSKVMYVTNRLEGSISLLRFADGAIVKKWKIPGGGSPDMGGVSADGTTLWVTGRYNAEVYAIDTKTGRLKARIAVGKGPHGLCIYPQPGRYSIGHTGIFR